MSQHLSLPKDKIRFLLLEGVHQNAIDTLNAAGYTNIDYRKTALEGEALKKRLKMHISLVFVPVHNSLKKCLKQRIN